MIKAGRTPKIDVLRLSLLLKSGKSQSDCAKIFNCSRAAVSTRAKELKGAIATTTALRAAETVVRLDIAAIEGYNDLVAKLKTIIEKLYVKMQESKKINPTVITLLIKALSESRGQLKLANELLQSLTDYEQILDFQRTVVDVIVNEVDPLDKRRIVDKLKESRLIRKLGTI